MRAFLFTVFSILQLSSIVWACDNTKLTVSVISDRRIEPSNHSSLLPREVILRIANNTGCSVFVWGHKTSEFFPVGPYLRLYPGRRKWESPFGGSKIPKYEQLGFPQLDKEELKAGGYLEFIDQIGDADRSVKFKRIVYISVGDSKSSPTAVSSPAFSFDGKLE